MFVGCHDLDWQFEYAANDSIKLVSLSFQLWYIDSI